MSNMAKVAFSDSQIKELYLSNVYFQEGYNSVIKNEPFNYDIPSARDAVFYERGRAFAVWCRQTNQPRAVWRKGVAAMTLMDRFIRARRQAAVI